ncbi:gibberellin 20-oxidase-like protein [Cornus florida]|uniref:gibberellin 20-oxidase-like protein n=1 Tax=Cornus florida TaxID=4283 RepID=UPI0028A11574|nr:gibberellin 20-oxidase-like protein [Cornus florida]
MSERQISVQLPILDLSQPIQPSFLLSLSQACREWGFFHIINHGVSKDLLSKVCILSKCVFRFPQASKLKLGPSSSLKTYTPHFIASPFFESLRVTGPDFFASARSSAEVLYDHQNSEFSEILQEYGNKMVELSKRIIELILMSMGDGYEKVYASEFSDCHGYLRIVNYSPPETVEHEEVEGLGKHTDMSCITIVYQDEVGGLQMRSKGGQWIDINPCESSLVVNIGDLMQAWSNGRLRSSEHRVVLKRFVDRLSLAFFWCFEDEKVIVAPDEVVGEGNSRTYKPFVCLDYLRFRENNEEGKFEKVGYTVNDFAGTKPQMGD